MAGDPGPTTKAGRPHAAATPEPGPSAVATTEARRPARPSDPPVDRRLARLHLRVGQLSLARAELEALAGSGELDQEGMLALAEARWRTGDLAGAGEAATAYLDAGGEGTVGFVIAAESVAAAGRPSEARRLAAHALERGDVPLDRLFAGMPRASIWPADPAEAETHADTLFGEADPTRSARRQEAAPRDGRRSAGAEAAAAQSAFWDAEAEAGDLPNAARELAAGRAALAAGSLPTAAVHLALVLRAAPELAPAVLEATNAAEGRSPLVELVRGDAFRLVGHELDARHAYSAAAALVPTGSSDREAAPEP